MAYVLTFVAIVLAIALGAFGLYLGYKLAKRYPRRKPEFIQTIFSRRKLD